MDFKKIKSPITKEELLKLKLNESIEYFDKDNFSHSRYVRVIYGFLYFYYDNCYNYKYNTIFTLDDFNNNFLEL